MRPSAWLWSALLALALDGTAVASPSPGAASAEVEAGRAGGKRLELARRARVPGRPSIRTTPTPRRPDIFGPATGAHRRLFPLDRVVPVAAALPFLGPVTSNWAEAKFFITQRNGQTVLQSNYRRADSPGGRDMGEAVLLADANGATASFLEGAVAILYPDHHWGPFSRPPLSRLLEVGRKLADRTVYVDEAALGSDGRPPVDLRGARNIRIVGADGPLATGKIELLRAERPPPPLMEALSGCCLKGRPPGRAVEIRRRLASHRIAPENTKVVSLVVDRSTAAVFRTSAVLRRIGVGRKPDGASWRQFLERQMEDSRGRNLVLLTHVAGGQVRVEGPGGQSLYSIPIGQLQGLARDHGVNLILLGCETSAQMAQTNLQAGVIGRYNTEVAAHRIAAALSRTRNGSEFLEALASRELYIVAQPGNWGRDATGGAFYLRAQGLARQAARVLRFWFFGGAHGRQG